MKEDSTISEIKKGLLVVAVLQVISSKRSYAGEILAALAETEFSSQEGTLYPLLSRLKREGLIEHDWVESPSGPPRKYYRLSKTGLARIKELMQYVRRLSLDLKKLGGTNE